MFFFGSEKLKLSLNLLLRFSEQPIAMVPFDLVNFGQSISDESSDRIFENWFLCHCYYFFNHHFFQPDEKLFRFELEPSPNSKAQGQRPRSFENWLASTLCSIIYWLSPVISWLSACFFLIILNVNEIWRWQRTARATNFWVLFSHSLSRCVCSELSTDWQIRRSAVSSSF